MTIKRAPYWIAVTLVVVGTTLCCLANLWPVYTYSEAPDQLSNSLASSQDFKQWYARLQLYETPHKQVFDWGCGLLAAGLGFGSAYAYLLAYERLPWMRLTAGFVTLWVAVWTLQAPLVILYYGLREERFDYPVWGDSVGIPIYKDIAVGTMGAALTLVMLALLRIRHPLPDRFSLSKATTFYGWARAAVIRVWIAFLLFLVADGIPDGAFGTALCCPIAAAMLFVLLCAKPESAACAR